MSADRINMYTCTSCSRFIVTVDRVEGTTPMMLACRAMPGCQGMSYSAFYRVRPGLVPDHEWYRPEGAEYDALNDAMKQHVDMGGLDIRRIGEATPSRV